MASRPQRINRSTAETLTARRTPMDAQRYVRGLGQPAPFGNLEWLPRPLPSIYDQPYNPQYQPTVVGGRTPVPAASNLGLPSIYDEPWNPGATWQPGLGGDAERLGRAIQENVGPTSLSPETEARATNIQWLSSEARAAEAERAGGQDDAYEQIQARIDQAIAARDAAIAAGQAEVAADYDDQIAKLNDAKAKLQAGRAAVNARFAETKSTLEGQVATARASELVETGTDVGAEVEQVSKIYDTGKANLNGFLDKIGAANPALAKDLGQQLGQFQQLAEDSLRDDLTSQGRVTQAASLVAKKLMENGALVGLAETEGERVRIESDLVGRINDAADRIRQLVEDKQEAMSRVRDQYGELDLDWVEDYEGVWDMVSYEFLVGQGLDREQIGEAMSLFDDIYFSLPSDKRNRAGLMEWADNNMFQANAQTILDVFNVRSFEELANSTGPDGITPIMSEEDVLRLQQIAENPNLESFEFLEEATLNLMRNRGFEIEDLDFVTLEDYDQLFDLIDFRSEFRESGYEEFRQEAYGPRSPVASNIDGSQLSRSDMAKVTSGAGQVGYVHPSAAGPLQQMVQAAAADGVTLSWSDTYRDYGLQARARENFLRTHENLNGDWVANIASPEGSNHPKGLAVDFTMNAGVHDWLVKNARRFGFGGISNEAHHWEYRGGGSDVRQPRQSQDHAGEDIVAAGPQQGPI